MHAGSITANTAAARVYEALKGGKWLSTMDITLQARTTCASTRISEVRAQLPAHETIESVCKGGVWRYRLTRVEAA